MHKINIISSMMMMFLDIFPVLPSLKVGKTSDWGINIGIMIM
jgi:hypothetical protein